jgi:pyridoxamine 5'-phosphate oxidase family protein
MESNREAGKSRGAAGYFTEEQAAFLAENIIGRLATVSPSGQPHVVPVAYRFDGRAITFGGWNLERSLKFRNMMSNQKVAFVVDEVVSTRPWRVRGLEVRGRADPIREDGVVTGVRIIPVNIRSWGLEG